MSEHLLELPLFAGLEPGRIAPLAESSRLVEFDPGTFIFREGDEARVVYFIRYGRVALQLNAPGRGTLTVQTLGEGELLGLSWICPPTRWLFDARVVAATRAVAVDAQRLLEACEADHELGYRVMRRMLCTFGQRLQAARMQLLDLYGVHT